MTSDRVAEINRLFNLILEQKVEDRLLKLDALRIEDPELCCEVEKRLHQSTMTRDSCLAKTVSALESQQDSLDSTKPLNLFDVDRDLQRVPQFNPGDVLSGRFTIVRFLARGGMGEVYEAADGHLQNRRCALKTLRPEIAADPVVGKRFEREVLLAREVSHPNVCPTYDIFRVEEGRGTLLFLTMKLLRGESLATRLHRAGRLDPEVVLVIAKQMAAALDAAHEAGVIHRDFKPGNVMLERIGADVRVALTDFGLSRLYESDSTLAQTGKLSGTPGYIAPEILQGHAALPAADVYSFGVVLHLMLTGQKPQHKPGTAEFVAPSSIIGGLSPTWDRIVEGCLEFDPRRRFQSAGEALRALETSNSVSRFVNTRKRVSRRRMIEVGGVAVAIGLIVAAASLGWQKIYNALHPLPSQRFVALMAWPVDQTPQNRPLLKSALDAIAGRLGREEAKSKDLLIISPGDVTGQASPKNPLEAMSALGANLVLAAALRASDGWFTLSLKVLDAATGKVLRDHEVKCAAQELGRLPEKATAAAADMLDVILQGGRMTDSEELARVGPATFQAFSTAEELVAQSNDSGLDQAIESYQRALDNDPRFALGYARISMAYARKFTKTQDPAILILAAKNADQSQHYNPDSAKAVLSHAMVDLYSGKTERAIEGIGIALRLDAGNPQVLLFEALAFRFLDRRTDEEGVYREIIRERPNYWPAYNELGGILHRHGNDKEAAEAFAEASAAAPRAALPLTNLGAIYMLLGRMKDAEDAFQKSLDRTPTELAYLQLGNLQFGGGEYRKALEFYMKARDLQPRNDIPWRNLGDCYAMLGEPQRVTENYAIASDLLAESLRTNPLRGSAWMTLAFYQAKLGRRAESETAMKEAESRGATDLQSQFKKAQVMALLGQKEEALRLVIECMDRGLSRIEVDLALDLAEVRADSRFRSHLSAVGSKL